jgi:hypothetical protein
MLYFPIRPIRQVLSNSSCTSSRRAHIQMKLVKTRASPKRFRDGQNLPSAWCCDPAPAQDYCDDHPCESLSVSSTLRAFLVPLPPCMCCSLTHGTGLNLNTFSPTDPMGLSRAQSSFSCHTSPCGPFLSHASADTRP